MNSNRGRIWQSGGVVLRRRGSTLILVLWTVGICTLIVLSLQVSAYRQSMAGVEAIGRVRAKWAARAGVEECIAYLGWEVEHADDSDPVRLKNALADLATGEVFGADWVIGHVEDGEFYEGPLDAHAMINVNLMTEEQMLLLEYMEELMARPLLDWIDNDDEPLEDGGVESQYYLDLDPPYEARNGAVRTLEELELVADMDPLLLRGEDWNLNGLLDANENDLLAAMGKYPDFPSLLRTRVIHQACKPIGSGSNWMTGLAEKGDNKAKFSVLRQQRITEIENAFQSERYDNIQCKYPYDDIRRILHTDSRIR